MASEYADLSLSSLSASLSSSELSSRGASGAALKSSSVSSSRASSHSFNVSPSGTAELAPKAPGPNASALPEAGQAPASVDSHMPAASELWGDCLNRLRSVLPDQAFNTWVKPLQPRYGEFADKLSETSYQLQLVAPNRFIQDWVKSKLFSAISSVYRESSSKYSQLQDEPVILIANHLSSSDESQIARAQASDAPSRASMPGQRGFSSEPKLEGLLGSNTQWPEPHGSSLARPGESEGSLIGAQSNASHTAVGSIIEGKLSHRGALNRESTFENFVEGKSNQLARAAALQVADNPGFAYNPLFIYGGVGLGKTHLMHAIGNHLLAKKPDAKIVYLHSETFVGTMVNALQLNAIDEFKRFYRSADALLIDDIQFFAGKERSQEEFFHTFNALLEGGQQIILTSDRYHKEINGLEERLKSRFGWGLTVAVEPPELETRAAILMNKAALGNVSLPNDAAMFIAQRLRSNVRELEGALKRVIAHANFKGEPISVDLIKEALRDLFSLQDKLVTIDNIQRTVAEYYKIKMSDMLSKRRNRSVARPRQVAMCLAKELTNHSLPEIGDAFGGRDHTTVMHACKQIAKLRIETIDIEEDYNNLLRLLSS